VEILSLRYSLNPDIMTYRFLFLSFLMSLCFDVACQQVTLTTSENTMLTYPFSDASPVMPLGRFYPYHRFDGFALKGSPAPWKTITMQNDVIRLSILPEVGGKIWGAYHLKTGFPFIYYNDVVKFRDIAARGPWTSGGVELNFGDYGHAPTCATPVDVATRSNKDGSKSTFLSAFDWSSRTYWVVEVALKENASFFSTRCRWHNLTPFPASNYQWMNAGFKASDDLEFLYPGTAYIDHDGKPYAWPVNEKGRNINFYKENNFGTYKSYHVLGETTDYFGGYWKNDDVGFIHFSPYYQKLGKKLWIWGLSRQGMIWEDLLTDKNGQYVELQSGRFYNQAGPSSIESPFKYNSLMPQQSDTWEEKWMTFAGTGGHTKAFEEGVLHMSADSAYIFFHEPYSGMVKLSSPGGSKYEYTANANAGETLSFAWSGGQLTSLFLDDREVYSSAKSHAVNRPLSVSTPINWKSEYGLYLKAKSLLAQRDISGALLVADTLIQMNPGHADALVLKATILLMQQKSDAKEYLKRALEMNTYHGWANFYWGYLHLLEGDYINAEDGFSVATTQQETKQSALYYLALTSYRARKNNAAAAILKECLEHFPQTLEGNYLDIILSRQTKRHQELLNGLLDKNPLNPFALAESFISEKKDLMKERWVNEMPHQNYIEMALWYASCGHENDALILLQSAPENIMVQLWKSYFTNKTGGNAKEELEKAAGMPFELAFPFRAEEFALLSWATENSSNWIWHYLNGKLQWSKGLVGEAKESFAKAGKPGSASFYLNKALLWKNSPDTVAVALRTAYSLDSRDWRVAKAWSEFLLESGSHKEAFETISKFQKLEPANYITGQVLAKAYFANKKYKEAVEFLTSLQSLPHEGASGLHQLFREACLFYALDVMKRKPDNVQALKYVEMADSYPENLGTGQPYDHDFSLTTYIRELLNAQNDKIVWHAQSEIKDFNQYLKINSKEQKEAYIAQEFYQQVARK